MGKIWLQEIPQGGKYVHVVIDNLEGMEVVRFTGTKSQCLQFVAGMTNPGGWAEA